MFVKLLPYLHQADAMLRMDDQFPLAYVFALGGMVALYGLEIAVRGARRRAPAGQQRRSWSWIFVLHLGAFAAYNAFLGALLVGQRHEPVVQQLLFLMALLLHNVVNDFSLREHHQKEYRHFGRWVLAVSVMAGWSAATLDIVPDIVVYTVIALVAGAIILNVLKEELPADARVVSVHFFWVASPLPRSGCFRCRSVEATRGFDEGSAPRCSRGCPTR